MHFGKTQAFSPQHWFNFKCMATNLKKVLSAVQQLNDLHLVHLLSSLPGDSWPLPFPTFQYLSAILLSHWVNRSKQKTNSTGPPLPCHMYKLPESLSIGSASSPVRGVSLRMTLQMHIRSWSFYWLNIHQFSVSYASSTFSCISEHFHYYINMSFLSLRN